MDKRKKAKLNMYEGVQLLCEKNLAAIATVVALQTGYGAFQTTLSALMAVAILLENQTGGIAMSKETSKKSLAELASLVAANISAFAVVTGNEELEEEMHITKTDIANGTGMVPVEKATLIRDRGTTYLASLGDYGVTAGVLTALTGLIDDFGAKEPAPKLSIDERKAKRIELNGLFKDEDRILKKLMDKLMLNLKLMEKNFIDAYVAIRQPIKPAAVNTFVRLVVVNSVNGLPIQNARAYHDGKPGVKRSSAKGVITYKEPAEGNHTFVVKHKLFEDSEVGSVMVSHGLKIELEVRLVPISDTTVLVREGDVNPGMVGNISLTGINGGPSSRVMIEVSGAGLRFYGAPGPTILPGPTFFDQGIGSVTMLLDDFLNMAGVNSGNPFLNVQGMGMVVGHYQLTFYDLAV